MRIFGEVERMVGPGEGGLQVAQQGVDCEELLEFHAGRAATGDRALVGGVATVLTLLALPAMYAACSGCVSLIAATPRPGPGLTRSLGPPRPARIAGLPGLPGCCLASSMKRSGMARQPRLKHH